MRDPSSLTSEFPNTSAPSGGGVYSGQGNPSAERDGFTPASPRDRAKIRTELGTLYFQAGNLPVAIEELSTAINADPSYHDAYSIRGLVYARLGEQEKANQDFKKALSQVPMDPGINNNYGQYLCAIVDQEKTALTHFMVAIKDPLYTTKELAYTNMGICAMKIEGMQDEAMGYLLKAIGLAPDGAVEARVQLAKILLGRGTIEEARFHLTEALKLMEPPTAEALWLGVRLEHRSGNREAEAGFLSRLRSRYPASTEYQSYLKGQIE